MIATAANPFAQLLRRSAPPVPKGQHLDAAPGTRTHELLHNIRLQGRATTRELADWLGISPNLVWGLLKYPRDRGGVRFERGYWEIVPDFPGADVRRAIELLEAKGYRVEKTP